MRLAHLKNNFGHPKRILKSPQTNAFSRKNKKARLSIKLKPQIDSNLRNRVRNRVSRCYNYRERKTGIYDTFLYA